MPVTRPSEDPATLRRHAETLRRYRADKPLLPAALREALAAGADWLESAAAALAPKAGGPEGPVER